MNRFIIFIICFLCASISITSFSQVTIGSSQKTVTGALLDLKEYTTKPDGSNSARGLLLPRLELTKANSLIDINQGTIDVSEYPKHTGLMVYNLKTESCENMYPGVYLWNGSMWNRVGQQTSAKVSVFVDKRDGENYHTGHFVIKDANTSTILVDAGEWMLENLRATSYDSKILPSERQTLVLHTSNVQPEANVAYYTYPNKDISKVKTEGYYYSGIAALNNKLVDGIFEGVKAPSRIQQGICPDDWRIPTYEDWIALAAVIKQSECDFAYPKPQSDKSWGGLILPDASNTNFTSKLAKLGGFAGYTSGSYNNSGDVNSVVGYYPTFITTYPVPIKLNQGGRQFPMYGLFSFTESAPHSQFHTSPTKSMPVRCIKGDGKSLNEKAPIQTTYDQTYKFLPNND